MVLILLSDPRPGYFKSTLPDRDIIKSSVFQLNYLSYCNSKQLGMNLKWYQRCLDRNQFCNQKSIQEQHELFKKSP